MAFLFRYLEARDVDPEYFAARCDWLPPETEGMEPALPMALFLELLEHAASLTENPDLGLDYYREADWAELGLLGFAHLHAATIADALRLNARYDHMVQNNTHFSVIDHSSGGLSYEYRIMDDCLPLSRLDNDLTISGLVYALRALAQQPDWKPQEVHFTHPAPPELGAYRELLGCPLVFDAATNILRIDAAMAAAAVVGGDGRLFHILEADLQRLQASVVEGNAVMEAVRLEVIRELPQGLPGIDQIASSLGMSRRSMQRRLAECRVTYKQLVEEVRRALSLQYLENSDCSLVEVALMLGYSELSAFIRAFRRWNGQTPQQYRLAHSLH